MLSFTTNNLGDVAIFECKGRMTLEGGDALRTAVLNQPYVQVVVLDLKEIKDIDAAGLGVLASLRGWAKATGTELKLMNLTSRVEKALVLTGLKSVFTICSARDMIDLWCRALHSTVRAVAASPLKQAVGF
ncbi:MAG TPA: STAS domain-containing protein [Candidatus Angelobacter sp.]|jgi:anti-anti-sigma factor|nr:STAS domain-containing protein [Candidatus Angelobacter sp.]